MEVTAQTAAEHVRFAEQRLREVIARQLEKVHGADWEQTLPFTAREQLEGIRQQESAARPHAPAEPNLLGYAGFAHMIDVCKRHWTCCVSSMKLWRSGELAKHELNRLKAVRNPIQHGRDIFPHEYIEGEGAARRLRFEIEALWRRESNMTDQYWLYMEQAEDSLGHRSTRVGSSIHITSDQVLYVGDTVHVKARAFDPHGRELRYRLVEYTAEMAQESSAWGSSPEFEWTATRMARAVSVDIEVPAEGDPHARPGMAWDAYARFVYEVRPRPTI